MLTCAVSGQFLYFDLVSVLSGFAVTGFSGAISGRKAVDGGTMVLLSGNIVEDGGGLYHVNLFDWDTSGRNIGYLLTASGCVPRSFSVVTTLAASGRINPASGANVVVPPASLSGVVANSGLTVTVPIASISGNFSVVTVLSGTLSGQPVTLLSGLSYTASGIFATATATVASGQVYLASGHGFFLSGQIIPQSGMTWIASGPNVNATATVTSGTVYLASGHSLFWSGQLYPNSGLAVTLLSGVMSGQPVTNILSGAADQVWQTFVGTAVGVTWQANLAMVRILEANLAVATAQVAGNVTAAGFDTTMTSASGMWNDALLVFRNGTLLGESRPITTYIDTNGRVTFDEPWTTAPASGDSFNIRPDHIHPVSQIKTGISGANVIVPPATLSGVVANSGLSVIVPVASISGVNATVPPATLSGVVPTVGIGALSGLNAVVPIASISGATVVAGSVLDKSGYTLHSSGLDAVTVESGLNARQALSLAAAGAAGRLQGAGTSLIEIQAAGVSGQVRISGAFDASGNRTTSFPNVW